MPEILDPVTQHHVDQAAARLANEFKGVFSEETIARYIGESLDLLGDSRHQRVRAGARAPLRPRAPPGARTSGGEADQGTARGALRLRPQRRPQPDGRGPGEAPLRRVASMCARPAATPPIEINPAVVEAMTEIGVDMSEEFPKPLTDEVVRAADVVITMGCGDACPIYPGKTLRRLDARRPRRPRTSRPSDEIRDEIDARVQRLVSELTEP